jgi:alkylhydroperoxidase family enzyme
MARLAPLPPETTPALKPHFDFFLGTLGFTPNSVLTMQRKPKLAQALAAMNAAVMDPEGEVDLGFRRLIGHVVSKVSGCLYCQAHTLLGARNFGIGASWPTSGSMPPARTTASGNAWHWTLRWLPLRSPTP